MVRENVIPRIRAKSKTTKVLSGHYSDELLEVIQRFVASKFASVAKDVVKYMGEHTRPGVKLMAKAVTEGVIEPQQDPHCKTRTHE